MPIAESLAYSGGGVTTRLRLSWSSGLLSLPGCGTISGWNHVSKTAMCPVVAGCRGLCLLPAVLYIVLNLVADIVAFWPTRAENIRE